jgi:tetratricopeptide (TPR) repeat protein
VESLEYFNKAIDTNPSNDTYYIYKSWTLNSLEKYQDSLEALDIATVINPTNYLIHASKAFTYNWMEDYENALVEYDKAIELNSSDVSSYKAKNHVLLNLGRNQAILDNFNELIEMDPMNKEYYVEKGGFISMFLNDHEEALRTYEKALSIWKTDDRFQLEKAFELEQINKTQATEYYNELINEDPNNSYLHYVVGTYYYDLGDYDKSLKLLDRAILLGPIKHEYFVEKGLALANLHDYSESMKYFDKAIKMNPDDPKIYLDKYEALRIMGDNIEAVNAYDEWLSAIDRKSNNP